METYIKLLNSVGLIFDIIGALTIFIYVFNKPEPLAAQYSMPTTSKTEIINGVETHTLNAGIAIDNKALMVNQFNKYKEKLFVLRARWGFYCLMVGFLLQIISNFGNQLPKISISFIMILISLFLFISGSYLFVYLANIPSISDGLGKKFTFEEVPTPTGIGVKINSDTQFQNWAKLVVKNSKRIGLM